MNKKILGIVGGVVGLALVILLALSIAGEQPVDASIGFGAVEVSGDPLPIYNSSSPSDVGVGLVGPTVSGSDWNDVESTIGPDGTPKIVMYLAHWCSHCQAEVPVVQQWINDGNLPDDVDMYSITTSTNRLSPNWPPQDWLEDEGWTVPTIMDDEIGTAAVAYGMAGTPFYVILDGENNVVLRVSGEIGVGGLNQLVAAAQAAG